MILPSKQATSAESLATISNVCLSAFVVLSLYFGRELLVPLALSILLTFMLAPLVTRLQRWFGRVGAVLVVVLMMISATGAVGWVLTRQAVDLANKIPGYKENIQTKLRSIQLPKQGPFSNLSRTFEELKDEMPGGPRDQETTSSVIGARTEPAVTSVRIVKGMDQRLEFMQLVVAPVLGPLGTAGLVLLLLVFMLLQRGELRNRLIRLVGQGRIIVTSRAMDDAGARVSKYLLMQIIVNITYGIPVSIGLYFIGVPNAVLWGALAIVLRFIPYLGPWIAAAFPILLSLASSPGWMTPLLTIALFIVLELISNNVMEPWLYGSSTGVTPIALIIAALAWTWLWGPVGLVLATPLTVCLVVMGRHIPKLAFLSIVLSDEEALTPAEDCYQRLLRAGEHDEMELVDQYLKENPVIDLFERVLLPVVVAAGTDHRLGLLDRGQLDSVENGVAEILDAVSPMLPTMEAAGATMACVPARAHRDQLAGDMLARLLWQDECAARSAAARMPLHELIGWLDALRPGLVFISVLAPSTLIHARYLCSKLRSEFPHLNVIVGLWGQTSLAPEMLGSLQASGATDVVTSFSAAIEKSRSHAPSNAPSLQPIAEV